MPYRKQLNEFQSKQLTGFYMKSVCTEWYFGIDYNHSRIMFTLLGTVLKMHHFKEFITIAIVSNSSDELCFKRL